MRRKRGIPAHLWVSTLSALSDFVILPFDDFDDFFSTGEKFSDMY